MAFTWNQVREVVDAALDLPPNERCHYLDRACPEPSLRRYVDSLVLSYDRAGAFLESPAASMSWLQTFTAEKECWVGRRLGPYRMIEQIGHGGMGSVYRAVRADDQFQKQVAIKVVNSGVDTAFALSRFRAERQILANLEHPNIARLIDGGSSENGAPYFVMELVEGLPIDEYCDSLRLPVRQRLLLFRSVCAAVEYAHQHLIVHRDLKPGNILITKEGVPKLLDFGIAKILSEESDTREAEPSIALLRILTPEYASPEQISGTAVGTSTDVYSLGVVLYLLLTGRRPYEVDVHRPDLMMNTICREEPLKPSVMVGQELGASASAAGEETREAVGSARACKPEKLRRLLSGDLDNIVLQALRKEPERRYRSVEQFSQDIHRHLEGLPVRARKETWGYRTQKFVSRNKIAVATVVLLLISLCAGLIATLYEARIARARQAEADRRFQDVRELANSLIFEVHDGVANLAGATPVRKLIVERALKYLDRLAKDAKEDRSLELELATAYDKIGDVQGEPMEANLGDPSAAVLSYQKALTLRESIAAEDPQDTRTARELIYSYIRLSDLLGYQGDFNRALDFARKEIPTAQKLVQHDTSDPKNEFLLASCYADQGFKEAKAGDRAAGLMTLRMGAEMFEHLLSKTPADLATRRSLALTYGRIGDIERFDSSGDSDSLTTFQKAAATLHPALIQDPNNTEIRRIVAYDQRSIGELLDSMNQKPAALSQEREALASLRKLAVSDPANAQLQKDIACVRGRIGIILTELGEPSNAITELVRADTALEGAQDAKVPQSYYGYRLLLIQLWLGKAQVDLATSLKSPWAQREEHCRQAQEWFQRCLPGFDSLREKGSDYGADQALNDIRLGTLRCQARGH